MLSRTICADQVPPPNIVNWKAGIYLVTVSIIIWCFTLMLMGYRPWRSELTDNAHYRIIWISGPREIAQLLII